MQGRLHCGRGPFSACSRAQGGATKRRVRTAAERIPSGHTSRILLKVPCERTCQPSKGHVKPPSCRFWQGPSSCHEPCAVGRMTARVAVAIARFLPAVYACCQPRVRPGVRTAPSAMPHRHAAAAGSMRGHRSHARTLLLLIGFLVGPGYCAVSACCAPVLPAQEARRAQPPARVLQTGAPGATRHRSLSICAAPRAPLLLCCHLVGYPSSGSLERLCEHRL